jgi:hypothetical protein
MRWSRIIRLTILLSAVAGVAVGGLPLANFIDSELQRRAQRPDPLVATQSDTQSILVAVLAKANFVGIPPPPPAPAPGETFSFPRRTLLLENLTVPLADQRERILDVGLEQFAPRKLREELVLANASPHSVANPNVSGVMYVSAQKIDEIFRTGFWPEFYRAYPHTAGFARISVPVLSKARTQALVYFEQHCDGLCGAGSIHFLVRTNHGWTDIRQELLWIS